MIAANDQEETMDDAQAGQSLTPREVPARILPVPKTVSPALQKSISNAAFTPRLAPENVPQTAEAWRRFAEVNNAQTLKMTPMLKAKFPYEVIERTIAGVTVREIIPASLDPAKAGRVLIHLHGGGYVMNGGEASISEAVLGAHHARIRVLSVDYRMPPDHPFPAAIDDAVAVWKVVIEDHAPTSVGVFGTSAGGGLTLAMSLKLKALGLPLDRPSRRERQLRH
jgi:monoterpene epsilon-lactone hydrolase